MGYGVILLTKSIVKNLQATITFYLQPTQLANIY